MRSSASSEQSEVPLALAQWRFSRTGRGRKRTIWTVRGLAHGAAAPADRGKGCQPGPRAAWGRGNEATKRVGTNGVGGRPSGESAAAQPDKPE